MKKRFRQIAVIISFALIVLGSVSAYAYFSDKDEESNILTVGEVDIVLTEDLWDDLPRSKDTNGDGIIDTKDVPDDANGIHQNQVVTKDPKVENQGLNTAWCYLQVSVPIANVITVNEDGSKNAAADTLLFTFNVEDSNWEKLDERIVDNNQISLYAYKLPVSPNQSTSCLFTELKYAPVLEGQLKQGTVEDVKVTAFAIQSDNTENASEAWTKYLNQQP